MSSKHQEIYINSLIEQLCKNGLHAYETTYGDIAISQKIHGGEYIVCRLGRDGVLILIWEVYKRGLSPLLAVETNLKIDTPHLDNLIQIAKLYFEHGKGVHANNPMIKELINFTNSRTKSARTVNLP